MCGGMWLDSMKVTVACISHGGSMRDLLEAIPDARARSTSEPGGRMRLGSEAAEAEILGPAYERLATVSRSELPGIPAVTAPTTEPLLRTFNTSYDCSCDLVEDKGADVEPPPNRCNGAAGPVVLDEISLTILQ